MYTYIYIHKFFIYIKEYFSKIFLTLFFKKFSYRYNYRIVLRLLCVFNVIKLLRNSVVKFYVSLQSQFGVSYHLIEFKNRWDPGFTIDLQRESKRKNVEFLTPLLYYFLVSIRDFPPFFGPTDSSNSELNAKTLRGLHKNNETYVGYVFQRLLRLGNGDYPFLFSSRFIL